jgi:hypothetical protein
LLNSLVASKHLASLLTTDLTNVIIMGFRTVEIKK